MDDDQTQINKGFTFSFNPFNLIDLINLYFFFFIKQC